MIREGNRLSIPVEWNNTRREYGSDLYIHQLFDLQAAQTPGAIAVVFERSYLTYEELRAQSDHLAQYLRRLGIGPDVLVGICLERSLELIVALLAILKAGGAYVPLDSSYPKERLAFMLLDSGVSVLITQRRLLTELPEHQARVLCLDDRDWVAKESSMELSTKVAPENLAYVIYTSGSTGKPKGAMNTHLGICNRLLWMQEQYQLRENDRVLQKTPVSFDVSVWELFWPLLNGAKLVMAKPGGHQDGAYLVDVIRDQEITVMHFVPSMLQIFLDVSGVEKCSSLRQVICSGEALSFKLIQRFFSRLHAKLDNLYGPTEAAVDVTYWPCRLNNDVHTVPIGRPVANTQTHILDSSLEPVSIGEIGELYLAGVQLARGYFNRPDLTAERFVPNPLGLEPGSRMYNTGDLARYLPDGNIEFLGRADHQVKIRGNRIELGEIEAVLNQHPVLQETVVVAREDKTGNKRLLAYIVAKKGHKPSLKELRDFVQKTLPDYMIPSSFTFLESVPVNPNGKADRAALPAPDQSRPQLEQPYVAPRTELERYLCDLWREILSLDQVGIHDRFFELGGDSIQAALFINTLREKLGEFLYIVTIFESPTVAAFASFLSSHYAKSLHRLLESDFSADAASAKLSTDPSGKINSTMIQKMRQLVPTLASRLNGRADQVSKNPPAIFILAPPRSGTTLLRVMLAGHPKIFAAPELQLLGFNHLMERRQAFTGKFSLWLEGTIRCIKEIKGCDAEEAKRIMNDFERENLSTKDFYRVLQEWIAPKILSDKSPAYVLDLETLKRAEEDFDQALYIHLVRHPYPMVRSFESYHFDQVLFMPEHPFSPRQLGELVWFISHQNTLEFLENVPEGRQYRMRFEDLVNDPQSVMEEMCEKINLEFHPDLLRPYENKEKKITDGIYAASTPMGDTKFLEYQQINPKIAEAWKDVLKDNFLSDLTWQLADSLGYVQPSGSQEEVSAMSKRSGGSRRDLLRRQKQIRTGHRGASGEKEDQGV